MNVSSRDREFMTLALRLAAKGRGHTSPNPMVGAVIVNRGKIVGQGSHRKVGGPHAEVLAVSQAGSRANGGTLYVTLEPCSHLKKRTPPCVPLVITSGVRRVVVGMVDPNPQVSGRGIAQLKRAGIQVAVGCLEAEAQQLNEAYIHWVQTGRPFTILKAGMTLDGQIATAGGESQWITGDEARSQAHRLRADVDAVLVGIGTVLRDDPQLTARLGSDPVQLAPRQPLRVVVDSRLRIPLRAAVLQRQEDAHTVIATTRLAPLKKIERLQARGIDVLIMPNAGGHLNVTALWTRLGQLGVTSLLVEGGSELNAAVLRAGLPQRLMCFVAPLLLGGQDAKGLLGGISPRRLRDAVPLKNLRMEPVGRDMLIQADFQTR
ncbi:MAG TPA: bifunctional diaminohydroxyphosphoribosylaminopyrimidine deaminase/5-amino-6-(5-phosphoribosylamino)uracil reductase RibD [Nitrospira sp.]|nr:bifunctional diaminohydroxyphosphoribosylaminopyrimidine deaminase/5-amino-6-(5-phosphoribosylamino)uracil reductase RibD [Nitrospira sp.]